MKSNWMKLAFAVVFGAAATVAAAPEALAEKKGCSASCGHGTCSTSREGADCGCCTDGTPYCGTASDCKAHPSTSLSFVVADISNTGGDTSVSALLNAMKISLDGSYESGTLIDAIYWFSNATLNGDADEIEAAQEYLNESYSAVSDEQALIALRVALNGMSSPAPAPINGSR
ncbi:Hypothetical protein A7982_09908 [Minicystis rosea]|nr:Hypothetical protein A7982_09908 [Minicystis rosea]